MIDGKIREGENLQDLENCQLCEMSWICQSTTSGRGAAPSVLRSFELAGFDTPFRLLNPSRWFSAIGKSRESLSKQIQCTSRRPHLSGADATQSALAGALACGLRGNLTLSN